MRHAASLFKSKAHVLT